VISLKKANLLKTYQSPKYMGGKDSCKGRLEAATNLIYFRVFCSYLVSQMLFLLFFFYFKTNACGNHEE